MKRVLLLLTSVLAFSAFAEKQPFERYQSIIDRQMFGRTPPGFDPTKPPSEVTKSSQKELTQEQEKIQSSIHFSLINITPDGKTAVGFTDHSVNPPVHYYLKVGERRNGWEVKEADPIKATMTVVKGEVEVSLELGANSSKVPTATAKAGGAQLPAVGANAPGANGPQPRTLGGGGLLGQRRQLGAPAGGSLRDRRAAREQERQQKEAEAKEKAEQEKAQREQEREEQRRELQSLKDELKQQREEAAAREKEREQKANEKKSEEAPADENNDA